MAIASLLDPIRRWRQRGFRRHQIRHSDSKREPLLRTALVIITGVYLLRGLALIPLLALKPQLVDTFAIVSSLIVLCYGVTYAVGTWLAWPSLRSPASLQSV